MQSCGLKLRVQVTCTSINVNALKNWFCRKDALCNKRTALKIKLRHVSTSNYHELHVLYVLTNCP